MNCPPSKPELNWLGYGRERHVLVEGGLYGLITQEITLTNLCYSLAVVLTATAVQLLAEVNSATRCFLHRMSGNP